MITKIYEHCSKCKNFRQHYVNIKNVGVTRTDCGHCIKHKIKFDCEHFEEINNPKSNNEVKTNELEIVNLLLSIKNYLHYFITNLEKLETQLKNSTK